MLKVSKSILMGVWAVLLIISAGFILRTHGWPKIYLIPPRFPSLVLGSFFKRPSNNILIYGES